MSDLQTSMGDDILQMTVCDSVTVSVTARRLLGNCQ